MKNYYDELSEEEYELLTDDQKRDYIKSRIENMEDSLVASNGDSFLNTGTSGIDLSKEIDEYAPELREEYDVKTGRRKADNEDTGQDTYQPEKEKSLEIGTPDYEQYEQAPEEKANEIPEDPEVQEQEQFDNDYVIADIDEGVRPDSLDTPGEIFSGTDQHNHTKVYKSGRRETSMRAHKTTPRDIKEAISKAGPKLDPSKSPRAKNMRNKKALDEQRRIDDIKRAEALENAKSRLDKAVEQLDHNAEVNKRRDDYMINRRYNKKFDKFS